MLNFVTELSGILKKSQQLAAGFRRLTWYCSEFERVVRECVRTYVPAVLRT
jgi:hypothetical protein